MFQLVYRLSCLPARGRDVSGTPFTHLTDRRLTINVCLPSPSCKVKVSGQAYHSFQTLSKTHKLMTFRESSIGQMVSLSRGQCHIRDLAWDLRKWKKLSLVFSYLGRCLVPFFLLLSVCTESIELMWSFYRNLIYEALLTIHVTIQFLKQYSVSTSCKVVP